MHIYKGEIAQGGTANDTSFPTIAGIYKASKTKHKRKVKQQRRKLK
jgi:hypothetical protein